MNDQINAIAVNALYVVPFVVLLNFISLKIQKSAIKNNSKNVILNTGFIVKNSLFVGLIVFLVMYLGAPLPFDDNILVRPADF